MEDCPNRRFIAVADGFLHGDHSVLDFSHAFRAVVNEVATDRPLAGLEVDLFYGLEEWETAGWDDRPDVVDRLRALSTAIINSR